MINIYKGLFGLILSCFSTFVLAADAETTSKPQLVVQQQPIHPACIAHFLPIDPNGTVSDAMVNLNVCEKINKNKIFTINPQGFSSYKTQFGGAIGYKVLGKLASGSSVLQAFVNGGGSGTFDSLFIVSVAPVTFINQTVDSPANEQTIVYLKLERAIFVGDRCLSGIANVNIQGNSIYLTQYQGQNAVDCSKTRQVIIKM
jgi:hypothetical protein